VTLAFGREKRLLLGALAVMAPLPLPFNEVLGWPFLLVYLAAAALFVVRARADRGRWLPPWAMNLVGLVYLPLFFLDLTAYSGGRLVGPVLHLGMFAVTIKLFALRRERDKWQALMGIFFLFLASMATSVHPAVTLYLAAFLAAGVLLLTRFALLHLLAGFGHHDATLARVPLRGFLAACVAFSLLLAVPLFALLPRVNSPYLRGGVGGGGPQVQVTGFSEEVTLDSIGRIRESREIALRVRYLDEDERRPQDAGQRFKAATFDRYEGKAWRRSPGRREVIAPGGARIELAPGEIERWATVVLQPVTGRSLPLPTATRLLDIDRRGLEIGAGGAVYLSYPPPRPVEYEVGLGRGAVSAAALPDPADPAPGTLDTTGVTPEMAALAAEVMGAGDAGARARRLEAHLVGDYDYTLDFVGRGGARPLEDFLFRYKSGHCEYFATAMALLLRSQGIHSRLATGFLGADYNPIEGVWVVRQANAHAWVEAYLPDEGWTVFDPTPPAGRPAAGGTGAWDLAVQAWEALVFRWDRYVLTYDFADQVGVFASLRGLWTRLFGGRRDGGGADPETATAAATETSAAAPAAGGAPIALLGAVLLLAVALAAWWLHRRGPLTATAAYRRLRRGLARAGVAVPASLPPLALGRRAAAARPTAAEPTGRVIAFYLRESFNGEALGDAERGDLHQALRAAEAELKKAG
jgi:transglutaminase-like putative cysteine protease